MVIRSSEYVAEESVQAGIYITKLRSAIPRIACHSWRARATALNVGY